MDLKNPTRTEALLANIAGHTDVPVPDMKNATRSERLLKEILDNGGGGGGDVTKEYVDTAIADAVADIDDDISALSGTVADKVDKENGKSLSTNDYTDADKALVQDSPITVTATGAEITASTAQGSLNALTVYGKSEVVGGAIASAGEGWATVDLGTLTWTYITGFTSPAFNTPINQINAIPNSIDLICPLYQPETAFWDKQNQNMKIATGGTGLNISNSNYTNASAFKAAMSGVLLCYKLANPTQGNAIAVKTDNGTGINGTMATFSTGTPLRGIPDTDVRDVMVWDGSSGEVTKNCASIDLGSTNNWGIAGEIENAYYHTLNEPNSEIKPYTANVLISTSKYQYVPTTQIATDKSFTIQNRNIIIHDTDYTDVTSFIASLSGVKLIYELATPTTEQLTTTENASIAGLRTFAPQTHAQNNAGATMTIEAYAGTANGKAVAELKSELKITQSDTLTLTTSGWSNNAQTITYAHDTAKRNVIDVDPASVEEWANCGVLATAETASGITFTCKTVPTTDLSFRVTSMEVR